MELTDSDVLRAEPDPSKDRTFIWDGTLSGFGLCVMPSGRKVYVLQYRAEDGTSRRLTLGKASDFRSVKVARNRAQDHMSAVRHGRDPAVERREKVAEAKAKKDGTGTLRAITDKYFKHGVGKIKTAPERRAYLDK